MWLNLSHLISFQGDYDNPFISQNMNESVTIKVLPPSSKGKMPLYVKALMSSRSYLYEKIGN